MKTTVKRYRNYLRYIRPWSIYQLSNFVYMRHFSHRDVYIKTHPLYLTLYITDRCTLNCKMCLQHSLDKNIDITLNKCYHKNEIDMTYETLNHVLKLYNKSLFVCLAGVGEPFLNPDLINMVKLSSINNKFVGIISNGTILNDYISSLIISPLDYISISLNATKKDEYIDISSRDGYLFETVIDNVNSLVKQRNKNNSKLRIGLSFVCHKGNYLKIPEMIDFSESLGVDYVSLLNLIPTMKYGFSKDMCLFNDDKDVIDFLNTLNLKNCKLDVQLPKLFIPRCENRVCRWYFENVSIDSIGNIGSCGAIMSPNSAYGNIFRDKDPWNNAHFIDMRRIFLDNSLPLNNVCKYCANNI